MKDLWKWHVHSEPVPPPRAVARYGGRRPVPQRQERVSRAREFLGARSPRFHRACLGPAEGHGMVYPADGSDERSGTCGGSVPV